MDFDIFLAEMLAIK